MRAPRVLAWAAVALATAAWACSPVYVTKAAIAEVGILRSRQPVWLVLADSSVDAETRAKLAWISEARRFAATDLGFDVGEAYTQYTELDRDTLAWVVSAAYRDRLIAKTWWFPIVGHVPYKGHFSLDGALAEQRGLERDGLDTYVRPTSAFSTLGWFNDPILSTALQGDEVEVVTTTFHELTHRELFVPGHVTFNESLATFVGRVAAVRFFCTREGGGPDSMKCRRAQARWRDVQRFGGWVDRLVDDLQVVYYDQRLDTAGKLSRREEVFSDAVRQFDDELTPRLESLTFAGVRRDPLNNATLLALYRYYHRQADFDALLAAHDGDLLEVIADLRARAGTASNPFTLLPNAS